MLYLSIKVENLIHNAEFLRSRTSAELCAVVKANAYGHGFEVMKYLNDYVDAFAVSCSDEAQIALKYTSKPIYVLSPSEDIEKNNVIYCAMSENDLSHRRICVKINSGMNRLGILPEDAESFIRLAKVRGVYVDSLYTHFSDVEYASIQLDRFMRIESDLKRHTSASNFLQLEPRFHLDMVRCGLALYGYGHEALKPVLTAYTNVVAIWDVKKGERVGYSFTMDRDVKIAVLGAGYADGIRRAKERFFVGGEVCDTLGNVCMDMCFVDVTKAPWVKTGDRAEFLGNISAGDVAERNSTIIYEILTSFGSRCRRIYE